MERMVPIVGSDRLIEGINGCFSRQIVFIINREVSAFAVPVAVPFYLANPAAEIIQVDWPNGPALSPKGDDSGYPTIQYGRTAGEEDY